MKCRGIYEEVYKIAHNLVDKIRRMEPPGSTVKRGFRPFGAESSV